MSVTLDSLDKSAPKSERKIDFTENGFRYVSFDPKQRADFMAIAKIVDLHLSEPYSLYVYWYFFHAWPHYCVMVIPEGGGSLAGVIIAKVEPHRAVRQRGYIGMIVIDPAFRGKGLAKKLVKVSIDSMILWDKVDEIVLETEVLNAAALSLYELFGFLRSKRMSRYYMNGSDAYRLILPVLDKLATRVSFLPPLERV